MSTRVTDAGEFFGTSAPDGGLVEAEIAAFDRFRQFLGTGLSRIQASDIAAPSAENVEFVVIQTQPPLFDRTQNDQAFHVGTAAARSIACVKCSFVMRSSQLTRRDAS
jgi:hypothetical protein